MKIYYFLTITLLFLYQASDDEIELFNFVLVLFGLILLIIILVYILLTSKEE